MILNRLTMCFPQKVICNMTTLLINFSQTFKRFGFLLPVVCFFCAMYVLAYIIILCGDAFALMYLWRIHCKNA